VQGRRGSLQRGEAVAAYLFLLPNIVGFLIFTLLAVLASAGLALTSWDIISWPPDFVGLRNFERLLTVDDTFQKVLWNTTIFTVASVAASMILSLGVALAMNAALRGIVFFRTAYYLPVVTSSVAVAVVWTWFYNPDFGPLSYYLSSVGVRPPQWLGSPQWALPAVIIVAVWKAIGYDMIIWLAGLQGIPQHLYEAASIDGASRWRRFTGITLPLLTPTTFFVLVISLIRAFQVFDIVQVMTDGGPADATRTMVLFIYDQGFKYLKMGYAAAVAWTLFLIVFAVTIVQWRVQKGWVHYE
jgi:multiple sugar transport system permease protein